MFEEGKLYWRTEKWTSAQSAESEMYLDVLHFRTTTSVHSSVVKNIDISIYINAKISGTFTFIYFYMGNSVFNCKTHSFWEYFTVKLLMRC